MLSATNQLSHISAEQISHKHSSTSTIRYLRHDSFELKRRPLGLFVRVFSSFNTYFARAPWECLRTCPGSDVDSRPRSSTPCWIPKQDLFGPGGCGCDLMMVDVSLHCTQKKHSPGMCLPTLSCHPLESSIHRTSVVEAALRGHVEPGKKSRSHTPTSTEA